MSRKKGDTGSKGFMKNSTVVSCCAFPMEKGSIFFSDIYNFLTEPVLKALKQMVQMAILTLA